MFRQETERQAIMRKQKSFLSNCLPVKSSVSGDGVVLKDEKTVAFMPRLPVLRRDMRYL